MTHRCDVELLWMVNTIHRNLRWKQRHQRWVYDLAVEFFAAVLTYVSATEQTRRSQVPLTAAVIYAMHAVRSALTTTGIGSMDGHYVIPRTVQNTFKSMSVTFDQVDELDLWSDECTGLASALLQPYVHWPKGNTGPPGPCAASVSYFQLALIAALYIDSTKQAGHASTAFTRLLQPINITKETLQWADVYDQTKLASYWYMAVFQEPFGYKYDIQDMRLSILEAIARYSEIRLSALHLLDFSAKDCCAIASLPSDLFTIHRYGDRFTCTVGCWSLDIGWQFNDWVLLHLDTLFYPSSIICPHELARLEWADTPEQMHIAKARLALYDQLQGEETKQTKQLEPEPHLLELCLQSNDYEFCTGAFKQCLNRVTISSDGDVGIAGMFIPRAMGCQRIEHLMQVLCGSEDIDYSWKFLNEHLVPIWDELPHSWCHDFASIFLFSNVHKHCQPAYQLLTQTLRYQTREHSQAFLPFLVDMLEPIKHSLNWYQLRSLETWLVLLPDDLQNQDPQVHVKLVNLLATRMEQIVVDETLRYFVELLMTYPEWGT